MAAGSINTTVSRIRIVNTFLCPSDDMAPIPVPANAQWSGKTQ